MRLLAIALFVVACVPPATQPSMIQPAGPAGATQPGAFVGTWVAEGVTLEVQEQGGQLVGSIHGGGVSGSLQGVVQGAQLVGTLTLSNGMSGNLVATSDGSRLMISVDGSPPYELQRGGATAPTLATLVAEDEAGAPSPSPSPQKPRPAPSPEPAAGTAPALTGGPATGERVHDQYKGREIKKPPGWKHGVQGGLIVLGHDTEPGAILVGFQPGVSFEQAAVAVDGEIRRLGGTPIGTPRAASV